MLKLERVLTIILLKNPLSLGPFSKTPSGCEDFFQEPDCLSQKEGEKEGEVVFGCYVKMEKGTKAYNNFYPLSVQFEKVLCSFSEFCNMLKNSNISDNTKGGIFILLMKGLYREIHTFLKDIEE